MQRRLKPSQRKRRVWSSPQSLTALCPQGSIREMRTPIEAALKDGATFQKGADSVIYVTFEGAPLFHLEQGEVVRYNGWYVEGDVKVDH